MLLRNGILKFYNPHALGKEEMEDPGTILPDDQLYQSETVYIQNIKALRLKDVRAKQFSIVYRKKPGPSRSSISRIGMNLTLRRGISFSGEPNDSNVTLETRSRSNSLSKRLSNSRKRISNSRKSLSKATTQTAGILKRTFSMRGAANNISNSAGSLSRRISRSISSSQLDEEDFNIDDIDIDDLCDDSVGSDSASEDQPTAPADDKDQDGKYEEAVVTIKTKTVEETSNWLLYILVALENQALVFDSFADILEESMKETTEDLRRHAVDLWAVAKGPKDESVYLARERLAKYLEKKGDGQEAILWHELSKPKSDHESDDDINSSMKRDQAFYELLNFLEHNDQCADPDEEARTIFEGELELSNIATKVYEKYKAIPEGWEKYLLKVDGINGINIKTGTPLEQLQQEIPGLKAARFFES
uniref:Uncharacterized protein n=1 Tax=Aplanochytrium stocchinoi TaxID=215587 RepID=A0A7S3LST4_9STRA